MVLLGLAVALLFAWWLVRPPQIRKRPQALPRATGLATCAICGDQFNLAEARFAPGAPELRCPSCFAELEAIISGIERQRRS